MTPQTKPQQIVVKQIAVEGANPPAYQYQVLRLLNRTAPAIGSILQQADLDALVVYPTVSFLVQL